MSTDLTNTESYPSARNTIIAVFFSSMSISVGRWLVPFSVSSGALHTVKGMGQQASRVSSRRGCLGRMGGTIPILLCLGRGRKRKSIPFLAGILAGRFKPTSNVLSRKRHRKTRSWISAVRASYFVHRPRIPFLVVPLQGPATSNVKHSSDLGG